MKNKPLLFKLLSHKLSLEKLLKEDIFGLWFQAKLNYSGRDCLVICYHKDLLDATLVRQLIRESEKLVGLRHQNLLPMLDYGYDGDVFYTIHENIDNVQFLDDWLNSQSSWPLTQLWKFVTQLLKLAVFIESKRLYCGCLSLGNLLVNSSGQVMLARMQIPALILKYSFSSFSYLDEAIFFAPNIFVNQNFDIRSDIYSFGIMLFYFFSQKWPYEYCISIQEMKTQLTHQPFKFIACHPKLPSRLRYVIETSLRLDPVNRFAHFSDLISSYKDTDFVKNPFINKEYLLKQTLQKNLSYENKKKLTARIIWGSVCFLAIVFIILIYCLYFFYVTAIPTMKVPNLTGLSVDRAQEILDEYGLNSRVAGTYISSEVPKGYLVSTKPPAGRLIKENREIKLFVSKGLSFIRLPDLLGVSDVQAQETLENLALRVSETEHQYSNLYPENYVLSQFPTANNLVSPSSNIRLVISKGFPVHFWHNQDRFNFFKHNNQLKKIKIRFMVLPEWETQKISIYFQDDDHFQKIYEDMHAPNNITTLEFELDTQGTLSLFFNDEKALESPVSSIINEYKNDLPF